MAYFKGGAHNIHLYIYHNNASVDQVCLGGWEPSCEGWIYVQYQSIALGWIIELCNSSTVITQTLCHAVLPEHSSWVGGDMYPFLLIKNGILHLWLISHA